MGARALGPLLCLFLAAAPGLPLAAAASRVGAAGRALQQLCGGCIPMGLRDMGTSLDWAGGLPPREGWTQPSDRIVLSFRITRTNATAELYRTVWVTVTRDGVDVTATILQGDAKQTLKPWVVEAVTPAPSPSSGQYVRLYSHPAFRQQYTRLAVGRYLGTPGLGPGTYRTTMKTMSARGWTEGLTVTHPFRPFGVRGVSSSLQARSSTGTWSVVTPTAPGAAPLFSEGHATPVRLCAAVSGGAPASLQLTVPGVTGAQLTGSPPCYQLPASFFADGGAPSQTHLLAVQASFACGEYRSESLVRVADVCSSDHALVLTSSSKAPRTSPVFTMTANFTDPGTAAPGEKHALRLQLLRSGAPVDFSITSPAGGAYDAAAKAWTYTVVAAGTPLRTVSIALRAPATAAWYTARATFTDLGNAAGCTAKTVPITSAGRAVTLQVA